MNTDRLTQLTVRNLQSLEHVTVELGGLTTIVGESNVGKSALVRAMRLLARNGVSTGLVRAGTTGLQVAAVFGDGTVETVKRGTRENEFQLVRPDSEVQKWTKVGRDVPTEVAAFWRIPTTDLGDLTFSTQHDAPFLLSVPGSQVAAVLGRLTNVSQLMGAVREANRRRVEAAAEVKARQREAQECAAELATMQDIPQSKAHLDECEKFIDAAEDTAAQYRVLEQLIHAHGFAQVHLREAEQAVTAGKAPTVGMDEARQRVEDWVDLKALVSAYLECRDIWVQAEKECIEQQGLAQQAHEERAGKLKEAGVCPVCRAVTT